MTALLQKQTENPCVRCGKARVTDKVWKEYLGNALIINTRTVCPDNDCQKIVDAELAARREKRELLENKHSSSSRKQIKLNREKKSIS